MTRKRVHITGIVQGVGFRPFVYNLALRHKLKGFCRNDSEGVTVEVEGEGVDAFISEVRGLAPPLSRVDSVTVEALPPASYTDFRILKSVDEAGKFALVSPDIATCRDCMRELFSPGDRRFGYPFINCTNCGPRYSIILDIPYDRSKTTMSKFTMCKSCEEEYSDPENRRFHAQPNACKECGPNVWLVKAGAGAGDREGEGEAAIERTRGLIKAGAVVAIKGLGGFHIACDAANGRSVERLRQSRRRSNKPFALMAPDVETVKGFCIVGREEEEILSGSIRPIVILEKRAPNPISACVAPSTGTFGVMLPYTPLHHLLLRGFSSLVMTSGNISEEPIVISNEEAIEILSSMVDFLLLHDRDIYMRVDDSIVRVKDDDGKLMVLRRARGYVPEVIDTGERMVEMLSFGGELKNTFTLTKDRYSIMSQHIGDLANYEAAGFFKETLKNLKNTFRVREEVLACDMHPDYLSTALAEEHKKEMDFAGEGLVAVQHHHAHVASAMAEHGLTGLVIGISFDGTGYGVDGRVWGGEFMLAERRYFCRRAHLKYVPMPGGDAAAREPWRMAASYLYAAYGEDMFKEGRFFTSRFGEEKIRLVVKLMKGGINSPLTSSAGRLFDGVSSLLGVVDISTFEAEAAITLETAARECKKKPEKTYPFEIREREVMEVDATPLIRAVCDDIKRDVGIGEIASIFHNTVVEIIVEVTKRLKEESGLDTVVLSGGVFQNFLILKGAVRRLKEEGFCVRHNGKIPINDGGISMGQVTVAWETVKVLRALRY